MKSAAWNTILFAALVGCLAGRIAAAGEAVDYLQQIKPLLVKRCYACHGALKQNAGLRVDTAALIQQGAESGPVVVAGDAAKSRLIEVVLRTGDVKMPPEGEGASLTADEILLLKQWINSGAAGPADELPQADPRDWWSYRRPQRAAVPGVKNPGWVMTPIDAFVAARHDELGLTPAPPADRATWLRRATFDLIGLPPTRAEMHRFLADSSADAMEKVVDDLLQRPQYGERWGRHWMDIWRYSDWYGSRNINEIRYSQRHIWRWRDWIVDSLNEDKAYDRMIVEMLAADEVTPTDLRNVAATGFIGRNWYKFDRNVWMFDLVEHTGQAFLGLTLKCARCHDHKYDPITQEEYYRFRAFFEPHDVRTDRLDAASGTEKDATLGEVLTVGVARVYDKQLDAKTYRLQRGDNRYPDESRPLTAGVPAALQGALPAIEAIALPVQAFYPSLQPEIAEGLIEQARSAAAKVETEIAAAKAKVIDAELKLAASDALAAKVQEAPASPPSPFFHDDFSKARPDDWHNLSGTWVYENGHLAETAVTHFATIASRHPHPRDFTAKVRYRPLAAAGLRSVGFSFDYVDQGNSQDVYTHTGDSSQFVQAFHRVNGQQVYPPIAIVPTTDLKVGEEAVVELVVRGQQLSIRLNGTNRLNYVMPVARRDGKFALWVHNGSAEFLDLEIHECLLDREDLRRDVITTRNAVALAELKHAAAVSEIKSLQLRIEAERAKYAGEGRSDTDSEAFRQLRLAASRAEKEVLVIKAEAALLQAEQHRLSLNPLPREDGAASGLAPENVVTPAMADADAKGATAKSTLETARAAHTQADGQYAPVGELFPTTSSGRRAALARWIASPENPRTARVAVNHIWLRHFGQALVPSVANFGLNGDQPSHPELLDWLALELIEHGWRMKPIHRMIVLSNAYRMSSVRESETNISLDPDNRFLWRMNSRRMEAEVVRDSVLFAAGSLDLARGGPEIPESQGQATFRRSLYFRNTPNEKMKLLELFDMSDPNACYRRRESVVPQQALALMNSALALDQSRLLAETLTKEVGDQDDLSTNTAFVTAAFETILNHSPSAAELNVSIKFLRESPELARAANPAVFPAGGQSQRGPSSVPHLRARENFVQVLFSHNAFVTVQ